MKSGMIQRLPGRRKSRWPVAFGRTVTAVFAALAMVGTPGAAAHAAQQARVRAGNDVSYPQCGTMFPSGQAFGIVAVNEGLPNNEPLLTGGGAVTVTVEDIIGEQRFLPPTAAAEAK
jgi:hypothetical protein